QSPPSPEPVSPLKSCSGSACAFQLKPSALRPAGAFAASLPPGARYQAFAFVPGIGNSLNDSSKVGYGCPGVRPPAPLSKVTRIGFSASQGAGAPSAGAGRCT